MRQLLFKPGELTLAHVEGRRVRYLHPWRLFLVINVLYFLVQPFSGFGGYNNSLRSQMERQVYSDWSDIPGKVLEQVRLDLRETLVAEGVSVDSLGSEVHRSRGSTAFRDYEERFNQRSSTLSRSLILLFIPCFAVLLWLLFVRSKDALAADHAVFATHFMSWQLLAMGCVYLPLVGLASRLAIWLAGGPVEFSEILEANPGLDWLLNFIGEQSTLIFIVVYLYLAARRAYGDGRGAAALRASALTVANVPLIWAYRFLLFWLTYWTV
ncbi:MAG: DUF3667 domain-containing protein [Rhodothermales bacterium]|nr:DUF3667 domain-containing protein [Rhodothermales bacterium]